VASREQFAARKIGSTVLLKIDRDFPYVGFKDLMRKYHAGTYLSAVRIHKYFQFLVALHPCKSSEESIQMSFEKEVKKPSYASAIT
jgi:hypothetical protein